LALKHVNRFAAQIGQSAGQPAPTRGRPKGSKNRKPAPEENIELVEKVFGNNAAVAEGL
jgi:hypothetical protein